jgi:hypothetical protein
LTGQISRERHEARTEAAHVHRLHEEEETVPLRSL